MRKNITLSAVVDEGSSHLYVATDPYKHKPIGIFENWEKAREAVIDYYSKKFINIKLENLPDFHIYRTAVNEIKETMGIRALFKPLFKSIKN